VTRSARLRLMESESYPRGLIFNLPPAEMQMALHVQNDMRQLPSIIQQINDALALMDECERQLQETAAIIQEYREQSKLLLKENPTDWDKWRANEQLLDEKVGDHRSRLMNWKSAARNDVDQYVYDFRVAMASVQAKLRGAATMRKRVNMDQVVEALECFDKLYPAAKDRRDSARHPVDFDNLPIKLEHKSVRGPINERGFNIQGPDVQVRIGGIFGNEAVTTGKSGMTVVKLDEVVLNLAKVMHFFYGAWSPPEHPPGEQSPAAPAV
jgi:hypothetical protein